MKKQTDSKQKLPLQTFWGQHAQNYMENVIFSGGTDLELLLEKVNPQAGWQMLDIAMGGGHTALATSDLMLPMPQVAREYHRTPQDHGTPFYARHDAEALPYADATFEAVICRITAHHFPDVQAFVQESARVLKRGGVLGIMDIISPAENREARYCNAFETLRDPSHVWAHSLVDWELYLELAGLSIETIEEIELPQQVGVWASRAGCDDLTIHRLRAMMIQAPKPVREWYAVTAQPGWSMLADVPFTLRLALMLGRKA